MRSPPGARSTTRQALSGESRSLSTCRWPGCPHYSGARNKLSAAVLSLAVASTMPASAEHLEVLRWLDAKLGALLALATRDRLPERAPAHKRSTDQRLRAAGLDVAEIAAILGKSKQAVYLALGPAESPAAKKAPASATPGKGKKS